MLLFFLDIWNKSPQLCRPRGIHPSYAEIYTTTKSFSQNYLLLLHIPLIANEMRKVMKVSPVVISIFSVLVDLSYSLLVIAETTECQRMQEMSSLTSPLRDAPQIKICKTFFGRSATWTFFFLFVVYSLPLPLTLCEQFDEMLISSCHIWLLFEQCESIKRTKTIKLDCFPCLRGSDGLQQHIPKGIFIADEWESSCWSLYWKSTGSSRLNWWWLT